MIKVQCPKCGSDSFDCYDVSFGYEFEEVYAKCYCDDCEAQFTAIYKLSDVEED